MATSELGQNMPMYIPTRTDMSFFSNMYLSLIYD